MGVVVVVVPCHSLVVVVDVVASHIVVDVSMDTNTTRAVVVALVDVGLVASAAAAVVVVPAEHVRPT